LQPLGLLLPERNRVARGLVVQIGLRIRRRGEIRRRLEAAVLVQQCVEGNIRGHWPILPPTGRTRRSPMPLMTPAAEAYQAAAAVAMPTKPPTLSVSMLFAKLPMQSKISVASSVRNTASTAMLTCELQSSMYV